MTASNSSYNPHRHQFNPEYVKRWNEAKPSERKKLLSDAGYQAVNAHAHRAWAFIPPHVREDVITVIKHMNKKARETQEKTTEQRPKQYWYDNI